MTERLSRALREHGDALAATLDTFAHLEPEVWHRPRGPGQWSPAQVAEHLVLTYEGGIRDLATGETARPRASPRWQKALRWFLLPHILFHGSFPLRARAPREWRPEGKGIDLPAALESLADSASRFEEEAARAHELGKRHHHPYFGSIDALRTLRLAAVHLEHHRRQVLGGMSPRAGRDDVGDPRVDQEPGQSVG